MPDKRFFYGLTLGIIGTKMYNSRNHKIKLIAIKSVEGLLSVKDASIELIIDIKNEAEKNRKDYYNKKKEYYKKSSVESNFDCHGQDNSLMDSKLSIEELENQINVLKKQMDECNKKMSQL
jgi:hypothetical protein